MAFETDIINQMDTQPQTSSSVMVSIWKLALSAFGLFSSVYSQSSSGRKVPISMDPQPVLTQNIHR